MRLVLTLVSFIFMVTSAFASSVTKVNLKGTNKVKHYILNVDSKRTVVLKGEVRESNISAIKAQLIEFKEKNATLPVFMIINSPGGSIVDGFDLINTMNSSGLKIYCAIESESASMAAIISQYCYKTYIHKYAALMFHEAAFGVNGPAPQVLSRTIFIMELLKVLELDLSKQMGISYSEYKKLIRDEWWTIAEKSARYGLVDGIIDTLYYTAVPPKQKFNIFDFDKQGDIIKHPLK